jgi:hypothetical protein
MSTTSPEDLHALEFHNELHALQPSVTALFGASEAGENSIREPDSFRFFHCPPLP